MRGEDLRGQAVRYLVIGGLNTVFTYIIFVTLGLVIDPGIAFTIAFAAGLIWVVFGSSKLVFRATNSPRRLILFASVYLLIYGVGRLIVEFMNPSGVVALGLTSLLILVISTPLSFFAGRFVFSTNPSVRNTDSDGDSG